MPEKLKIQYRKLSELTPYERNARVHSDEQVEQIAKSIKEFGFANPILVDKGGTIIAGHGRYAAAELLKMKQVPTVTLDNLTDEQRRALTLADNKLALNAAWDYKLVKMEANELQSFNFDIGIIGFTENEILAFFGDQVDDPQKEWNGMPEFDQPDGTAFRSILVHFHDQEGVDAFAEVTKLPITPTSRYAWYPEKIVDHAIEYEYSDASEKA